MRYLFIVVLFIVGCDCEPIEQCGRFETYSVVDGECRAVVSIDNTDLFFMDATCDEGYVDGDEVCGVLTPIDNI